MAMQIAPQPRPRNRGWRTRLLATGAALTLLSGCSHVPLLSDLFSGFDDPGPAAVAADPAPSPARPVRFEELARNTVSDNVLGEKRGGIRIAGIDFAFGLQLRTLTEGVMQLTTNLVMNDSGRFLVAGSQGQIIAPAGSQPTNAQIPLTITNNTRGNGPTNFTAVAGDPSTTQIVQQVVNNSISTLVTNRVNGVTVDNEATLNVTVNNANKVSAALTRSAGVNSFAEQMTRLSR